ncbi:MAG: hypothetical protein Q8867_09615 [Bacteroidota bacterium]|nr:hypothetical protein [Bacteroidota bacterium]
MKSLINPIILLSFSFLFIPFCAFSQDYSPKNKQVNNLDSFWHRVTVGGNLGFQFGDATGIMVMPESRIRIVDQLYGGLGFTYEYSRFKNYYYDTQSNEYLNYTVNVYGGRVFFRYYLSSVFSNFLENIFAHVEYEYLTYITPYKYDPSGSIEGPDLMTYRREKHSIEVNSMFVGGGYRQPLGQHTCLDFLVLYNLNDTYDSPYTNPVFRVGFGYTF